MNQLKMRFIENLELREWVKENLRKAIFQKAHALAIQTGCEILVKLQDEVADQTQGYYYATNHLGKTYNKTGVHKQPGDLPISGETGLPVIPMVDQAIQSHDSDTQTTNTITTPPRDSHKATAQDSSTQRTSVEQSTAVPVQLSLDTDAVLESQNEQSSSGGDTGIKQEAEPLEEDITVKLEVIEEDADIGDLQTAIEQIDDMQVDNNVELTQDYQNYSAPVPMSPKPYQCGMCHKAFRSIQVLQKHTQTFHMRAQNVMSRKRGAYGGGAAKLKQQMSYGASEQQRFQCVVCNRGFRHLALLEDHMNRSHMVHPSPLSSTQQTSFSPTTSDAAASQSSSLQLIHDLAESGPQDMDNLPKITSVASLHHLAPNTSGVPLTTASTSSSSGVPFAQGSPMAPMYRHPGPSNSATTSQQATGSSSSSNRARKKDQRQKRWEYYNRAIKRSPTKRLMMAGILLSPSPVNSYRAFKQMGPMDLRNLTKEQYIDAARELAQAGVGVVVTSENGGVSYVKKVPQEIQDRVEENFADLCTFSEYRNRFYLPVPRAVSITWEVQQKLQELGVDDFIIKSKKTSKTIKFKKQPKL
ncbi:uncharacterized protein [Amphiura filiformis]|uniref:uncharacterized protein isoform X2 n=1 Tax=Amphiura filiformis TaxID=82378 RepID=UPI003B21D54C